MPEKQHTPKEKIEKARLICEKYATGQFTIESCVENQGISAKTFNLWHNEITEISEMYKEAKARCTNAHRTELKLAALTSLRKLVDGQTVEEIHQEGTPIIDEKTGKPTGKMTTDKVKRITKHFLPNVTAVIFALKAMDPLTFKENVPEHQAVEQVFLIGGKEVKF